MKKSLRSERWANQNETPQNVNCGDNEQLSYSTNESIVEEMEEIGSGPTMIQLGWDVPNVVVIE